MPYIGKQPTPVPITTSDLDDDIVSLAKMAGLARGKLIYGDASGDPAALAVGAADEVLTHDGTDFDWAAAGGGVNTPLFRAKMSTMISISHLAYTKIAFDTCSGTTGVQDFIVSGSYDTTNNKWTPGEAGYYQITAQLYAYTETAFDYWYILIRLNGGSDFLNSTVYQDIYGSVSCTGIAHLQSTDYVDVVGYQNVGSDLMLPAWSGVHFMGHKLIS